MLFLLIEKYFSSFWASDKKVIQIGFTLSLIKHGFNIGLGYRSWCLPIITEWMSSRNFPSFCWKIFLLCKGIKLVWIKSYSKYFLIFSIKEKKITLESPLSFETGSKNKCDFLLKRIFDCMMKEGPPILRDQTEKISGTQIGGQNSSSVRSFIDPYHKAKWLKLDRTNQVALEKIFKVILFFYKCDLFCVNFFASTFLCVKVAINFSHNKSHF